VKGQTSKQLVHTLLVVLILTGVVLLFSQEATAKKPTGEEESAGNCLSVPVIWSDGVTKSLRGVYGTPVFLGAYENVDGVNWYLQQDPMNMWQAESLELTPGADPALSVDLIDWGDNLEAKDWSERDKVRVETVLWKNITATPMDTFEMLWLSGEGMTEMWGTNGTAIPGNSATVYSGCARLTLQKLTKDRNDPTLSLTWNPATGEWAGDADAAQFNGGVWEGGDGPGYYSAEINIGGKVIYGYNWDVRDGGEGPGSYRITFSLADDTTVTLNTLFTEGITEIMVPVEESEEAATEEEPPTGGGAAKIDYANNLTYIDVNITAREAGHGGGGHGNRPW